VFDRPVHPLVDRLAGSAAGRAPQPVKAVLLTIGVGFMVVTLALVVIGELITHAGVLHGLRDWDEHLNRTFAHHRTPRWTSFSSESSGSAETLPVIVGGLAIEAVVALLRRWRDLLLVPIGLLLELTVFLTVNEVVRRPRPSVVRLGSLPQTFSFPSGHIAATVVLYGCVAIFVVLTLESRLVTVLAWMVVAVAAIAVGSARVYRGMHHPLDVVAGAAMGLSCLLIAAIAVRASALAGRPTRTWHEAPTLERSEAT